MSLLNSSQQEAVNHKDGPALIIAGPGTGKTSVITQRVKRMIEEYQIEASSIMVLTFTKASALEMEERFNKLMSSKHPVLFGTFHSVYFRFLKKYKGLTVEQILKEEEKFQILKIFIKKLNLNINDEKEFIQSMCTEISLVKSEEFDISTYSSTFCDDDVFRKTYLHYKSELNKLNKYDFDDLIIETFHLLNTNVKALAHIQSQYKYFMVDEFQDTNKIQFKTLMLLVSQSENLFIVGDEDQSIYKFRGARPDIMLSFEKIYPNTKKIILDINYRSSEEIVKSASRLIQNNTNRFEKTLISHKGSGSDIIYNDYANSLLQVKDIISKIKDIHELNIPYNDIAIIFRTNNQAGPFVGEFLKEQIPFNIKDTIPNLYDHWISKHIISYIKIAIGQGKNDDFVQIANKPNRFIPKEALKSINGVVDFETIRVYYNTQESWKQKNLNEFIENVSDLINMTPTEAIHFIREFIDYDSYLEEYAKFSKSNKKDYFDILEDLQNSASKYTTYKDWFDYIIEYTNELKNQKSFGADKISANADGVVLSTMHTSKGLEYDTVFIIDVNDGVIPYWKANSPEDIEEERRMMYVAMTRAKNTLFLSSVKELRNKKSTPSYFLRESNIYAKKFTNSNPPEEECNTIDNQSDNQVHIDTQDMNTTSRISNDKVLIHPKDEYIYDSTLNYTSIFHVTLGEGKILNETETKYTIFFIKKNKNIVIDKTYALKNKLISFS